MEKYITLIHTIWSNKAEQAFWENYAMIFLPMLVVKLLVYFFKPAYILAPWFIMVIQDLVGFSLYKGLSFQRNCRCRAMRIGLMLGLYRRLSY